MRRESEKDEEKDKDIPLSLNLLFVSDGSEQKKKKAKAVMFEPPDLPEENKADVVKHGRVGYKMFSYSVQFRPSVYLMYLRAFSYHWAIIFSVLLIGRHTLQVVLFFLFNGVNRDTLGFGYPIGPTIIHNKEALMNPGITTYIFISLLEWRL